MDMGMIEQLNIEFLSTPWFYICVAVVTLAMKWFKDQDEKIHKRWYMPAALAGSFLLAVLLVLMVQEYTWATVFIHGSLIYIGQHFLGDQVLKRIEGHFKEGKA